MLGTTCVTWDEITTKMELMPEPPKASMLAIQMLDDVNCSLGKVAEFLNMDECLTAKLLKLSNSALFGCSGKVTTVKEALTRLGAKAVRSSLWSYSLEKAGFRQTPFFIELWKSSLFTALLARDITDRIHGKLDVGFTGGLLCDIGQLVMHEVRPEEYQQIIAQVSQSNSDIVEAEREAFGYTHMQVGQKMAGIWKLPVVYQNIIQHHHEPLKCRREVLADDYKLIVAIHIANNLSPLYGNQSGKYIQEEALSVLGNSSERWLMILKPKFENYYEQIEKITQVMFSD